MSDNAKFKYYYYEPSVPAAAAMAAVFGVLTVAHAVQLVMRRTWYFVPFVIGCIAETIGYIGRVISAQQSPNYTLGPYIMQTLLILIAPAFFAASIYMILGRLITSVDGAAYSIIPVRWLTIIFVSADVLSFLMQASGGGLLGSAKDTNAKQLGQNVIIAGLFVQVVAFGLFMIVAALFHQRIVRQPTQASQSSTVPWQRYLWVLYAVCLLIFVRCIFRVIEYIQGFAGSLQGAEYWLYIFDAALMLATVIILNVFHPSNIIPSKNSRKSAESGEFLTMGSMPASRDSERHGGSKHV